MKNLHLRQGLYFLIAGIIIILSGCGEKRKGIHPTLRNITESVYSSITIQPDSLYDAYSTVAGIVDHCFVKEGDLVIKGQALIHIVNDQSQLMKENSALNLNMAQENLDGKAAVLKELKDELESARLKQKNDSANYFRQKRLWEQAIGSQVEYDNRKLAYEVSSNNLRVLQKKYRRTELELQTMLKQAENNFQSNLTNVKDFTIESKINGKVYEVFKEQGEIVSQQFPVASVGSADQFVIDMLVDEVDIVHIKTGQTALITLDAYENQVYKAEISRIYPSKNERTQTFRIEGRFIEIPEKLYPGLSGEANIIIQEKENAVTIPLEYVVDGSFVETENGLTQVNLGLKSMTSVEVIDGLDTTMLIYKPAP